MIFDFYFELSINRLNLNSARKSFFSREEYAGIVGKENTWNTDSFIAVGLNRGVIKDYHQFEDNVHHWLYGYAYTNSKFKKKYKEEPRVLNINEIIKLKQDEGVLWHKYLKGHFFIITFDVNTKMLMVTSDYLNMLPLYYAEGSLGELVISTNTSLILENPWVNKEPDNLALGMQQLFDYTLGEHYFVKGIRRFENARTYTFRNGEMTRELHWEVDQLKKSKLLPRKESLKLLGEQLKSNVDLYSNYSEKALVSLTGGFDGRTNLAVIGKDKNKFKCYSYGKPGSKQIRVPKDISEKIGIQYEPILLDSHYLKGYDSYDKLATYFSNGTAPIGFGNIVYAFSKLRSYSETIITGLLGSEVLRPLHNNQIQVNDQSFAIFLSNDLRAGIEQAIENRRGFFLAKTDVEKFKEELYDYLTREFFDKYKNEDSITRFFYFIIQEGLRKYFSQELSIERVYVTTMIPYFDIDFVELIYQSTWAGIYNGFLRNSKVKRRKGQLLYANIMKTYKPSLLSIKLDRGYSPGDLLKPIPLNYFYIAKGVYSAKNYMKKHGGNDTFDTLNWAENFLREIISTQSKNGLIQIDLSKVNYNEMVQDGPRYLTFRHLASMKLFLNQ